MNPRKYFLAGLAAGLFLFVAYLWLVSDRNAAFPESTAQNAANLSQGDFSQWMERYESSNSSGDKILQEGIRLAKERKIRMAQLIRSDPQRALEESLSFEEWQSLPKEVKPYVEEPILSMADVDVYIACGTDFSEIDRWTTLEDGSIFQTFIPPGNRFAGTRKGIRVEGIRLGEMGALWNAFDYEEPKAMERADATTGTVREMYVILVDFSDHAGEPVDPANLENYINTNVSEQIHDMSNHQSYINCTVNPKTYRLPNPITHYQSDHLPMHTDAVNLVQADGIDLSSYDTVCVYFRRYTPITFAGYASLPGSEMWINGYYSDNVITHELGHNYGSYHASSWDVTSTDPVDPAGASTEYGDPFDIMGSGQIPKGHFHIQNKVRVGWLQDSNYTNVTASGTYRIYRTDHPKTDPAVGEIRGLRIDKGTNEYYWVGYRQLFTEHENTGRGVYVLWQQDDPYGYVKSHLLDMTPGSTGGKWDGGLAMGKTYSDTTAGIHITPVGRGGYLPNEYMDVVVNLDPSVGNSPPTATIDAAGSLNSEESITFSITATDPNGDDLAYFWDFGDGLVYPNSPVARHAFSGTGDTSVRCTVSDMKGGSVTAESVISLTHPLESWTSLSPVTLADIYDVTYGNGTFVAVGSMGTVATSTDAETWTTGDIGGDDAALVILEAIIFDGSKFITVGNHPSEDYFDFLGVVYTSSDATTWTRRYLAGNTDIQLHDIAYNGSATYIAVGDNAYYLSSSDGFAWSTYYRLDGNNNILDANHAGISYINGAFPVVGTDQPGTTDGPMVAITFSGFSWSPRNTYSNAPGGFSNIEVCNGSVFSSGPYFGINRSTNRGYNFDSVYGGSCVVSSFAYGNGIYFGAGHDSFNVDVNLVSQDGVNWHELPTILQENRNAAFFYNNRFYTLGNRGSLWKSDPVGNIDEGWARWQRYFSQELSVNRDSGEDQDFDGIENILEYALGTDPGDPTSVPAVIASRDESGHLKLTIPRGHRALDLDYIVEQSSSLGGEAIWTTLETDQVSETDTELVVRTKRALTEISPQFLRLRVDFKASAP